MASGHTVDECWTRIDIDACINCRRESCERSCDQLAQLQLDTIAAFVLEPVLCSGGIIVPPAKAVQFLARAVADADGLVVADEVTTGLGRVGEWLGADLFQLAPDIIAFGKMLGNGYPVSAVAIKKPIADALEKTGFRYVQSHQNDPLGCAVAKEVVAVLEEGDLIAQSRRLGAFFKIHLEEIAERIPAASHVRGTGLMLGLQLRQEHHGSGGSVAAIVSKMRERGFLIGCKPELHLLRFMPPLIVDEELILNLCRQLGEVLEDQSAV